MSYNSANPALIQQLEATEKGRSPFESEIRHLSMPVVDVFVEAGKIAPAQFEATSETLPKQNVAAVQLAFPNLFPITGTQVLKAVAGKRPVAQGKKVAVMFSGGPAAGGHNVIAGLKHVLGAGNTLLGVKQGPKGLLEGRLFEITDQDVERLMNTGGFDFLGSDRTKIKTDEQFQKVKATCQKFQLDALVVVGGDDSNTNAAMLAEFLFKNIHADGRGVQVLGVPKTIDGDLQEQDLLPISFGFDTATKIYSELVGNILQDTPSSRKYWHFIKLMGRSASHVALEVALQTKPALTFISEEIEEKQYSLSQIVDTICRAVAYRAGHGINHGVVLIPEGLIEFIPEMKNLIRELNEVMAHSEKTLAELHTMEHKKDFIYGKISAESAKLMAELPDEFENMLLLDRDSHGNLQVSQIPTETLLIEMATLRLREMRNNPEDYFGKEPGKTDLSAEAVEKFVKFKFATNNHFFGYEGRCGAPSRFDAAYTFNLGVTVGSLALAGKTAYVAAVTEFGQGGEALAIPLTGLIHVERRHGKDEMVIEKALVKTDAPAFKFFAASRDRWMREDCFASPGPRQLWGPTSALMPISVALNQGYDRVTFNLGKAVEV